MKNAILKKEKLMLKNICLVFVITVCVSLPSGIFSAEEGSRFFATSDGKIYLWANNGPLLNSHWPLEYPDERVITDPDYHNLPVQTLYLISSIKFNISISSWFLVFDVDDDQAIETIIPEKKFKSLTLIKSNV